MRRLYPPLKLLSALLLGSSFPLASASDVLIPGTDFHATGSIPCATATGQPMTSCPFGVRREGSGSARVTVFLPDGATRLIRFEQGRATGIEGSTSGTPFSTDREGDLTRIRAGDERFEIPDAVVSGG
ncbi:hypothetical protein CCR95_17320 [Thiocystis minor]|uniref:hypothetical protein n=1 Tax=Thiocystis minor TaxID=61597 RepID=UPI0019113523|nr:hypothetical protein [Thiocystis minor]MBK5965790.1 hypothetical protein [Thiocystis minor]